MRAAAQPGGFDLQLSLASSPRLGLRKRLLCRQPGIARDRSSYISEPVYFCSCLERYPVAMKSHRNYRCYPSSDALASTPTPPAAELVSSTRPLNVPVQPPPNPERALIRTPLADRRATPPRLSNPPALQGVKQLPKKSLKRSRIPQLLQDISRRPPPSEDTLVSRFFLLEPDREASSPPTLEASHNLRCGGGDAVESAALLPRSCPSPTSLCSPIYTQPDAVYTFVKMLGHGGSASVEMVQHNVTGSVYARKKIRNVYTRNLKQAEEQLLKEVRIMRRLAAHRHIVQVHATYVVKRELAILLEPVANGGDLAAFLQDYRDRDLGDTSFETDEYKILWRAFGCLASGLAFMHRHTIRHKDIKPQNILIHNGMVMYTDFGLSYDFGAAGQSTTIGAVQGLTRRYCAPEVADHGRRNTKSDVFSLGCVYIEICAVLPDFVDVGPSEELLEGPFFEKLGSLSNQGFPSLYEQLEMDIIRCMVQLNSKDRPTARDVVAAWALARESDKNTGDKFCDDCVGDVRNDKGLIVMRTHTHIYGPSMLEIREWSV